MNLSRRHFARCSARTVAAAAACAALFAMPFAQAQEAYPSKPIKVIVPFAAGGGGDVFMRTVAAGLGKRLGQPVLIENRGGAAGNLGMEAAAKAAPDGYTIVMMAQTAAVNPYLYKKLSFDVSKDFIPIGLMAKYYQVLVVNAASPITDFRELVARAKAAPGTLSFGSSGAGGASHLAAEQMMKLADIKLLHVPYKGVGPALNDLLGGQISMMFDILSTSAPQINAGKLRALGVASPQRQASMPNVPALAEFLPGMTASGWLGLAAPAGTPPDRIALLSRELSATLDDPQIRGGFTATGYEVAPSGSGAAAFGQLIQQDLASYQKLVTAIGLQAE